MNNDDCRRKRFVVANSALGRRFPDRVEAATGAESSDFLFSICVSVPFINFSLTGVRRPCQYNGSPRTPNAQPPARQFYCIARAPLLRAHGGARRGGVESNSPAGRPCRCNFPPVIAISASLLILSCGFPDAGVANTTARHGRLYTPLSLMSLARSFINHVADRRHRPYKWRADSRRFRQRLVLICR